MDLVTYYRPKWGSTVNKKRDTISRTATTFQTVLKSFNKDVLPLKAKELAKTQQKYSERQMKHYQAKEPINMNVARIVYFIRHAKC